MSTHKHFDTICVVVLILTLAVTILFMNGESLGITVVPDQDRESYTGSEYFTENDLDADWDEETVTVITLNGSTATVSGPGAYANDGSVTIVQSGYYRVSGTLDDGSLIIDAKNYSKVWIRLDGVTITTSDRACIDVKQADKVFLTLSDGSANVLNGASAFSDDAEEDGIDAVLFSHDDVTINGSGTLTIDAPCSHGIAVNDGLVITGGTVSITASGDAIHVNNSFRMTDASLVLTAQDEGIDVDEADGYFYLASGTLSIESTGDGIHAEGAITVDGGSITIETSDDGIYSNASAAINGGTVSVTASGDAVHAGSSFSMSNASLTLTAQDEGIDVDEADGYFYLASGALSIESAGDAIHAEGAITIDGGTITIETSDDGIHSESSVVINGGSILIPACYEGIEAPSVEITGGDITIYPSDDGINANGGTSFFDPGRTDTASTDTDQDSVIRISGGSVTIVNETGRDADGLDSNGSVYITGGTIFISLADSGANCAVDFASENGGIAQISGGTLIACGSFSMAESFDSSSTQCVVLYNRSSGFEAGTLFTLKDETGEILLSEEIPCAFSSVLFSCDAMKVDGTYSIVIGNEEEAITLEKTSSAFIDVQSGMLSGTVNSGGMQPFAMPSQEEGNTDGTMPQMPDGFSTDEMPQMPNSSGSGEQPQMPGAFSGGERPQMPEGFSGDTMPQMPGSFSGNNDQETQDTFPGGDMPQMTEESAQSSPDSEAAQDDTQEHSAVTPSTWMLIGVSVLVLIAGILIAVKARSASI